MTKRSAAVSRSNDASVVRDTSALLQELRQLIGDAQRTAAAAVNVSLTALYWRIGKRIHEEVLGRSRADTASR